MLRLEKITDSLTYIAALDPELEIFDIIMKTQFGSTYNSYLIDGGEELVLIDTAKEKYIDEYFAKLNEICDINKIRYLIVNHTEPDHSGEIHKLLEKMPWLKVVGTPCALGFLKDISNSEFEKIEVKEGTTLQVGNKRLSFVIAPNLHWPDSMFTYLHDENILFTCDVFGAHYCSDKTFHHEIEDQNGYNAAFKYYYDCIFGPFKPHVIDGLNKINNLQLTMIAPSHGPMIREGIDDFKKTYLDWSKEAEVEEDKITIVYTSAYGYTTRIAEEIKKGIEKEGLRVSMVDLLERSVSEAVHEVNTSFAFLVGSPTLNADTVEPVWSFMLALDSYKNNGKLAAGFGSFGWSGEAVRNIESRLSMIKCEVYRPGLRIKFNPDDQSKLEKALAFGETFAKKVLTLKQYKNTEWSQIKTGKWKCLVCGEIFEGEYPPDTCPACGAPSDQFIELKDENSSFHSDSNEHIAVIGSGIAAISAIEAIRKRSSSVKVTMISEDEEMPYYRIQLSKLLCTDKDCRLKDERWFNELNVEKRLGKKVTRVIGNENKLILDDNSEIIYDKLIIACGARANARSIHGDNKVGVFTLRHKRDYNNINRFVKQEHVKKVVIIGGGILGVEIASAVKKIGKEAEIIEYSPRVMVRQLDDDAASIFQKHIEANGVRCKTSETVEEIYGTGEDFKYVCGVKLAHSQDPLECQMVIMATGISTNLELLKDSGVSFNKGIIVDEHMKTNIANIFACGDVAEFNKRQMGLWSIALEQGKIAGAAAVGDFNVIYNPQPPATNFNGFGYNVFSIGDIGKEKAEEQYQILELSDPKTESFRKFYFLDDQFVGGILMGNTTKSSQLRKAIDKGSNMQTFLDAHFLDE